LTAQLARLPGWAGHARWQDEWAPLGRPGPRLRLLDLVAVRVAVETAAILHPDRREAIDPLAAGVVPIDLEARASAEGAAEARDLDARTEVVCGHLDVDDQAEQAAVRAVLAHLPGTSRHLAHTTARELRWRDRLLDDLGSGAGVEVAPGRPAAQVLCCIDVRSEGLRRHLEERGEYHTLGVAGFFGMPATWQPLGSPEAEVRAPVLLTPAERVTEAPAPAHRPRSAAHLRHVRLTGAADDATHTASHGVGAPFAYAEAAGWLTGPLALLRTLLPARWRRVRREPPPTRVVLDGPGGFSLAHRVALGEALLTTVGLTDGLARLVVLCGHGARTTNNPHAASLDCGACGGAPGGASARIAAAVLNDPGVRRELEARGVCVPEDTWFVAAEHDTVADSVTVLDRDLVPHALADELATLEADLAAAGAALAAERAASLPGLDARLRERGADWAQVRPEWGLAGNAAFFIGPRSSTVGHDLARRVFLHSYRAERDPDGAALETILTAPLVVAHWINAQYLFSTVDPVRLGAGDKLLHNPIGGVGVTLGDGGDLCTGLPLQSTRLDGRPVHDPLRLLALVEAPRVMIARIVDRNPGVRDLIEHGWIHLVGRDDPGSRWFLLRAGGRWEPWTPVPASARRG
ncbi:MAG: putative inorganic carbon transporter subunit DabA, partial [Nitriliruptoraceae bacterium]